MTTPLKIADALERVKLVTDQRNSHIIKSSEISRADREMLILNEWLQEIIKGWYFLTRPDLASGDSTAWYTNFWDFIRIYCQDRFGKNYCLSAEDSLELHIGCTLFPKQIIILTPKGNSILKLPFGTSVVLYGSSELPKFREEINGLQVMSLPLAICKATPNYFRKHSDNIEIALKSIRAPNEITRLIVEQGFMRAAERILGAYDFFGLDQEVSSIKADLAKAGMLIKPIQPFEHASPYLSSNRFRSPYAARIKLLWSRYRDTVLSTFPKAPGLPKNPEKYLDNVDKLYEYDAYNSLSIEGYQVSAELIAKVKNNHWNPDTTDTNLRNALAARGYYEAFQSVMITLKKIISGKNLAPGKYIEQDLSEWYQNLFHPSVTAGIISQSALIGYRNDRVFIRNSLHSPPPKEAVLDCMDAFFECLQEEKEASVRAVLGHYIFVFIHPYMDGNGRIARFILNTMLASGGYQWTIVQMKRRKEYINSLEFTHTKGDVSQFTKFIKEELEISKKLITGKIKF